MTAGASLQSYPQVDSSADLQGHLHGQLHVTLRINLRYVGLAVPQAHLCAFESFFFRAMVAKLCRS